MKNAKIALAALFVLISLSACSKSNSPIADNLATPGSSNEVAAPVADTSVPDACKLLTKEIAESVLGPIGKEPSTQGSNAGTSNCMYIADDFSAITLLITSGGSFDEAFAASKSISGVDPVRVDGIGDGAYWAGGTLNQLNVLKNGKWMIFMAPLTKDPQTVLEGVAQKVLANM